MRKLVFMVLLTCVMATGLACRPSNMLITPEQDITSYKVSAEKVRAAIVKACTSLTWRIKDKDANTITATIVVRNKHTVVVDIPYTATSYSINYVRSTNMEATSNGRIHPNYNNWVIRLSKTIDQQLALANM